MVLKRSTTDNYSMGAGEDRVCLGKDSACMSANFIGTDVESASGDPQKMPSPRGKQQIKQ